MASVLVVISKAGDTRCRNLRQNSILVPIVERRLGLYHNRSYNNHLKTFFHLFIKRVLTFYFFNFFIFF